MQQSLIRYLRSAMPQMREGRRPSLGQQVSLCSAFLEIMSVRMEGRLQPVVSVPEGLKSAGLPIDDVADAGGKRHQAWP
jgi:LytS/YehU family sensor histidine kinase